MVEERGTWTDEYERMRSRDLNRFEVQVTVQRDCRENKETENETGPADIEVSTPRRVDWRIDIER